MTEEVLAVVEASAPRRWLALGVLAGVGLLSIYIALASPPAPAWLVFLIAVGAAALWLAHRLYLATEHRIELTRTEIRASSGERIALVADVEGLDRGVFAFKPSNGFLIRVKTPGSRVWQPGMWWRLGRRIGVGGVTPGSQTKAMAEILSALMAQRG